MTILGKDVLIKCRPHHNFCILDKPLDLAENLWPTCTDYEQGIFIDFAEDLLGIYCGVTRSYSPFEVYEITQLAGHNIYEFTSKLLFWGCQIARTPLNYFVRDLEYAQALFELDSYTCAQLKSDMIETLHFMVEKMHQAAAEGKCVVIVGI